MPTYDYHCAKCDCGFEIIKYMSEHQRFEKCPSCGNLAPQDFSRCKVHLTGTKIENAEYNPGLGKVTKSKRHREELAKQMGAVEVGNEKPDTIHKHFDSERQHKMKRNWEEV